MSYQVIGVMSWCLVVCWIVSLKLVDTLSETPRGHEWYDSDPDPHHAVVT